jgi:glycogen debranching enzyme
MLRCVTMLVSMLASMHVQAAEFAPPDCVGERAAPALLLHRSSSPEGASQRIVASDRHRGDLDARAYAWLGGSGYRMHAFDGPGDLSLLRGFAGVVDGALLPRAAAASDTLRPWGHEVRHDDGAVETLRLGEGRSVVLLCVRAGEGRRAALLLLLGADAEGHMALRASVPVREREVPTAMRDAVSAPDDVELRLLEPVDAVGAFQVQLAFSRSAAEAARVFAAPEGPSDAPFDTLQLRTGDARFDAAFRWAIASNATFRTEEFGPGLWAGLPWFRDNWGRDTFIALPGTHLVTGEFERADAVIAHFARLQNRADGPEQGRVPNRVAAATDTLYNTVDGTPWLIRAAWETAQASGDTSGLPALRALIRDYVAGAERHLDGDGLLRHAEADTWMDARIRGGRGWSPRGDRAIEIQALWHAVLAVGADLATRADDAEEAARYAAMAGRTREAVLRRFWNGGRLADRLLADDRVDTSVRPNAWMAVSVPPMPARFPFLPREIEEAVTRDTAAALLLTRGPLSLGPGDARFHPVHVNDAHHHKDAAYHNGTVWPWTAGPAISALTRFAQQETAYRVTRELARQILEDDAPGHLAELTDATLDSQGRVRPSGTYAQSWSTAEFVRNAVQDYLGVRPRLLDGTVAIDPALPAAWADIDAVLPLGRAEPLRFTVTQGDGRQRWTFAARATPLTLELGGALATSSAFAVANHETTPMTRDVAPVPPARVVLGEVPLILDVAVPTSPTPWPLADEPAPPPGGWPVLRGRDVLERFIESGGLDRHPQPTTQQLLLPESVDKETP